MFVFVKTFSTVYSMFTKSIGDTNFRPEKEFIIGEGVLIATNSEDAIDGTVNGYIACINWRDNKWRYIAVAENDDETKTLLKDVDPGDMEGDGSKSISFALGLRKQHYHMTDAQRSAWES